MRFLEPEYVVAIRDEGTSAKLCFVAQAEGRRLKRKGRAEVITFKAIYGKDWVWHINEIIELTVF